MAETWRFSCDKEADVLDISVGRPRRAVSREIEDDVFIRFNPHSKKIIGFSILNFTKRKSQRAAGAAADDIGLSQAFLDSDERGLYSWT